MKGINVLSMNDAIRFRPRADTLMIRIFGSRGNLEDLEDRNALEHEDYFREIFSYQFDDILPSEFIALGGRLFTKANARQIIGDFRDVAPRLDYLAVHCYAGISRSSAVASSLNHIFNLGVKEEDYINLKEHNPNMHIYNTMVETARELGMEFDFCKSGDKYFLEDS
jgi:predicted protein tyrosine phosphatase